jgi:hypothetical protein
MKWVLVAIMWINGEVSDSKMFGAPTEAICKEAQVLLDVKAKEIEGAHVWSECREVTLPAKTHPYDKKSERAS